MKNFFLAIGVIYWVFAIVFLVCYGLDYVSNTLKGPITITWRIDWIIAFMCGAGLAIIPVMILED